MVCNSLHCGEVLTTIAQHVALLKPCHVTLLQVQRSKSFHTAVVQYYSVVGHSPSLITGVRSGGAGGL